MNKKTYLAIMLAAPLATACVNNDYNLSDVDTTLEMPVKDLVVPITLSDFSLETVLDIEDNDKIRDVNGEYAVVTDGNFKSDRIDIDKFVVPAVDIEPIVGEMTKRRPSERANSQRRVAKKAAPEGELVAYYDIPKDHEKIEASTADLSNAIKSLQGVAVDTELSVTVDLDKESRLKDLVKGVHIEDFEFTLPRGIQGEMSITTPYDKYEPNYDPETGRVSFKGICIDIDSSGEITLNAHITGLDENAMAEAIKRIDETNETTFVLDEEYGVTSGYLAVYMSDAPEQASHARRISDIAAFFNSLPETLDYKTTAMMKDVTVDAFSGEIDYAIDDFNAENVSLADVPDLLQQSGTNISLANPQLYVYIENPMADGTGSTISASAQVNLKAHFADGSDKSYNMDVNKSINAGSRHNYFLLSPEDVPVEKRYTGFESAQHISFEALSDILASSTGPTTSLDKPQGSMPESVDVSVTNAHIFGKDIKEYELGQSYNINGYYVFYAPLEVKENSSIRYEETVDGWEESLEDVVIEKLDVTATISTDVPFELQLRVRPIKADGTTFDGTYSTVTIPANASGNTKTLSVDNCTLTGLDGIRLEALAVAKETNALRPDMKISIKDLKVKVSGAYKSKN